MRQGQRSTRILFARVVHRRTLIDESLPNCTMPINGTVSMRMQLQSETVIGFRDGLFNDIKFRYLDARRIKRYFDWDLRLAIIGTYTRKRTFMEHPSNYWNEIMRIDTLVIWVHERWVRRNFMQLIIFYLLICFDLGNLPRSAKITHVQ